MDTVHYSDVFLFVEPAQSGKFAFLLGNFVALAKELEASLTHEKTKGSASCLTSLRIELDMVQQLSWLPVAKLAECKGCLIAFRDKCKASVLELQQSVGYLNFACRVLAPNRPSMRSLCNVMAGLCQQHHSKCITKSMQEH